MFCRAAITVFRKNIRYTTLKCAQLRVNQTLAQAIVTRHIQHAPSNRAADLICRSYSTSLENNTDELPLVDSATYDRACTETLESLCEYFEDLTERAENLAGSDVAYSVSQLNTWIPIEIVPKVLYFKDGVLTVNLGNSNGIYVINRQTPNKQIWLSSPTSGPKRYDLVDGKWIYKHTGESMHELLQNEIGKIFKTEKLEFKRLPYST